MKPPTEDEYRALLAENDALRAQLAAPPVVIGQRTEEQKQESRAHHKRRAALRMAERGDWSSDEVCRRLDDIEREYRTGGWDDNGCPK
jgi:hypothetical protein